MRFFQQRKGLVYEDPYQTGFHRRLLNSLLLVLGFRLLANIPVAHVDSEKLNQLLAQNPLLGAIDLLAGGDVLKDFSVVAVGLFPYLLAAGLVRLAARVIPRLRQLEKETEKDRVKTYTRAVTLPLALAVAWGLHRYVALETGLYPEHLRPFTGSTFWKTAFILGVMTFGSWLTEKITDAITKHGIGTGTDVLLLVGSSLTLVTWTSDLAFSGAPRAHVASALLINVVIALAVILTSIPLLTAVRKVPMLIPRVSSPPSAASAPFLPLQLNHGGTTPITSAIGFLFLFQLVSMGLNWAFPGRLTGFNHLLLAPTRPEGGLYWLLLAALVILFTYITNFTLLWKPYGSDDLTLAEHLRRNNQVVTGHRPGDQTADYLSRVMAEITLPAAVTLAFLAAGLPYLVLRLAGLNLATAVLAEIIFVKSLLSVRETFRLYRLMDGGYADLLQKGRRR